MRNLAEVANFKGQIPAIDLNKAAMPAQRVVIGLDVLDSQRWNPLLVR
ncbi:hypothetical protein [Pseudomonas sp. SCB32]|nr:hypothetical protein [Pseudomonas sp. SCB32]